MGMKWPGAALAAAVVVAVSAIASAWEAPPDLPGRYGLAAAGGAAEPCRIELLAAPVPELEGVWFVARPLHDPDNQDACRGLGIDDVIAWSDGGGPGVWLLAEGAGLMSFEPAADGTYRLARPASGAGGGPDLVLTRIGGSG